MKTLEDIKHAVSVRPLKPGGSNFKTHTLKQISSSKLKYKPSIGGVLFCLLFLIIGLVALGFAFKPLLNTFSFENVEWFLVIFGSIFSLAGGSILYVMCKPRVFNKQNNIYYKSYFSNNQKNKTHLNSIVAIQIIGEIVSGDKASYNSFELNLVLNDNTRKNVVDHGNLKYIINDAHIVSKFLDVPIWHAATNKLDKELSLQE